MRGFVPASGMQRVVVARRQQLADVAVRVVEVAEVHAVRRADGDARRIEPLLHPVDAERALVGVSVGMNEARVVRARRRCRPCSRCTCRRRRAPPCPRSWTWLAPVGQHETHGGLSQWLHRSDRISMCSVGYVAAHVVRDPVPVESLRHVILRLAGHDAVHAADAPDRVDRHAEPSQGSPPPRS